MLVASCALAQEADPWLGPDKALHFGASAALATGGYAAGAFFFEEPAPRLAVGAGLALTAGAAKELYDLSGRGQASWKDMTWNVAGAATGLFVSYAVDRWLLSRPAHCASARTWALFVC